MTATESDANDTGAQIPSADRMAVRIDRAATELMAVEHTEDRRYEVASGSGNRYTVDLDTGMCTCPDADQRGAWCKHAMAALYQTGEIPTVNGVVEPDDADHSAAVEDDESAESSDDEPATLAERVEAFADRNPNATPVEAMAQLGINPDRSEEVEEVLA